MAHFSDKDTAFVPPSYEDLYEYYIVGRRGKPSLTKTLVRHYFPQAPEDEREALCHDVFVRCMEKDVLKIYDPMKANFGGVIFFVTRSVCVNYLDRRTRCPLTGLYGGSIQPARSEIDFEPGVFNLDTLFQTWPEVSEKRLAAQDVVRKILEWAGRRKAAPKNKRDQSLLMMLELLLQEFEPKECAPVLGVTTPTVNNWILYVREQMVEIIG